MSTLFSRYKTMINDFWSKGITEYTAKDLNNNVGDYEKATRWKLSNNNPYYTTRLYQSMLKHLGAVTKIHRGKWKINGPVPEWFGSFQLSGLNNKGTLRDLEYSSIYWKSLPDEHKVNPWLTGLATMNKTILTNNINNTQTMENTQSNTTSDIVVSAPGIMLSNTVTIPCTTPSGIALECVAYVNLWDTTNTDEPWSGECSDMEIFIVSNRDAKYDEVRSTLITLHGDDWFNNFVKENEIKALHQALAKAVNFGEKTAVVDVEEDIEKKIYSKDDLYKIMQKAIDSMLDNLSTEIEDAIGKLSAESYVDLSLDYNKCIEVEFDANSLADDIFNNLSNSFDAEDLIDAASLKYLIGAAKEKMNK